MVRNTKEVTLYAGTKQERVIGFRSGTRALAVGANGAGINDVEEFIQQVISGKNLFAIQWFFYGCAVQYCEWKSLKVDFSCGVLSEWTEDIGLDVCSEIMMEMLTAYFPKNPNPPEQPGVVQPSMNGNISQSQPEESVVNSSGG